jgi:hypothetical protein
MVWLGRSCAALGAFALFTCSAISRPALAQYYEEAQPHPKEDVGEDDVEQRNAGRVEGTESEKAARARRAREDEAPVDASASSEGARLDFALRTGYALPVGDLADGGDEIADGVAGQVPIWADLGVRYDRHSFFGLYFAYGIGVLSSQIADGCDRDEALSGADVDCSARVMRFGIEYLYHARSSPEIDPWVGFGMGWEWLSMSESASLGAESATVRVGFDGLEYFNLQAGVDYAIARPFSLGAFLMFTLASYGNVSISCDGDGCASAGASADITSQSTHSWIGAGVKATFLP